jgi:4-hydroxy-tetrahydrodipicolinate synthase
MRFLRSAAGINTGCGAFDKKQAIIWEYPMLKGSITAIVTPFTAEGKFDEKAFRGLVNWQIDEGTHGLVPVGTTGETPTLSHDEHKRVIEVCIEEVKGRVPVIAGAGSNNTVEAIELAQHAQAAGADAVLVVTPYYNKPNQRGLYAHFSAVATAITIPLVIYNIPGRSIIDMTPETMAALVRDHKNIIAVKDATGKIERVSEQRAACGHDFIQISGEDATALGFNAHGGRGCISVTSNVAPRLCAQFQEACLAGDYATALTIQDRLMPLHKALFLEPNPSGPKYALSRLGRVENHLRLPLVPITEETAEKIDEALRHAGLLNS